MDAEKTVQHLSQHARELLLLIEERTASTVYNAPDERMTFVPNHSGSNYCRALNRYVIAYGSESASALRALERRGLIRFNKQLGPYASQITEDGLLVAQSIA